MLYAYGVIEMLRSDGSGTLWAMAVFEHASWSKDPVSGRLRSTGQLEPAWSSGLSNGTYFGPGLGAIPSHWRRVLAEFDARHRAPNRCPECGMEIRSGSDVRVKAQIQFHGWPVAVGTSMTIEYFYLCSTRPSVEVSRFPESSIVPSWLGPESQVAILWGRLITWYASGAVLISAGFGMGREYKIRRRITRNLCVVCGYPRAGLGDAISICPECGRP